jgi:hypothetical protein
MLFLALKAAFTFGWVSSGFATPLSPFFTTQCARCHGAQGQGKGDNPNIKNVSYETLVYSVRTGRSGIMPPFSVEVYPQTALDQDYVALTNRPVASTITTTRPLDISGVNPEISPQISYLQEGTGPKSKGWGFALDPFVLPYVYCKNLPSVEHPGQTQRVCANVGISGNTEPGYHFADFGVCSDIRTQRPYRNIPVKTRNSLGVNDKTGAERLADPHFARELAWVTEQVRAGGCVCCHDSKIDRRTAFWDISKGPIWTDQLDAYAIEVFTGRVSSVALGAYHPDVNFGFDRRSTGLPTTDVPRMQSFFMGLADDLKTTDEQIKAMPPLADFLASQLRTPPARCAAGIGVDSQTSKIHWKIGPVEWTASIVPARFVFVLAEDAQTPLVTPNLDKPIGTYWRIDAPSFWSGFRTGTVRYGQVPQNGVQTIPDPVRFGAPKALEVGKNYRLVVQLDMAFPLTNCLFTYGD